MRFTFKHRISAGLGVIMAIGIVSMLSVAAGFFHLHRTILLLSDSREPTAAAAYELEISVWAQGMSVLRYLQGGDARERDRALRDSAEFERFYLKYAQLAHTVPAREVLSQLRSEYDRFRHLGTTMMAKRDRHEALRQASARSCGGALACQGERRRIRAELGALEKSLHADGHAFTALRDTIDAILDGEIQVKALDDLATPRFAADRATRAVLVLSTLLMPLFIVAVAGVGAITEARIRRVNAELNRQTANRERIEQDHRRLEAALRRSEVLSALGSIVAGVSHEVRNPLFGISSTVDALAARLKRDRTADKYERHVEILRAEVDRLSRLMHDLLDYGKPHTLDIASSSVADAVTASISACASLAAAHDVKVLASVEPDVSLWPMDRTRIDQVLRNLLENAIQHSRGGTVAMDVRRVRREECGYLQIRVRDQGPGFDPSQLEHVFEPFFTRRAGGTGLGLSIVERIVDAHGGMVRASNYPEGGAEITIELPDPVHPAPEVVGAA